MWRIKFWRESQDKRVRWSNEEPWSVDLLLDLHVLRSTAFSILPLYSGVWLHLLLFLFFCKHLLLFLIKDKLYISICFVYGFFLYMDDYFFFFWKYMYDYFMGMNLFEMHYSIEFQKLSSSYNIYTVHNFFLPYIHVHDSLMDM